jgi:hypothetical protein
VTTKGKEGKTVRRKEAKKERRKETNKSICSLNDNKHASISGQPILCVP